MIYVLAYPEIEPSITEKLDAFRLMHEPKRAELVRPHITLMFGLTKNESQACLTFCAEAAAGTSEIALGFHATESSYDPFEKAHKLFLMSLTGRDELIALHEQLYAGPQRSELAADIPYRPHMTIATNQSCDVIEQLDTAAIGPFPYPSVIRALDVVELANGKLISLGTIPLQK